MLTEVRPLRVVPGNGGNGGGSGDSGKGGDNPLMMFWKGYNDLLDKQPILTKVRGHIHPLRSKVSPWTREQGQGRPRTVKLTLGGSLPLEVGYGLFVHVLKRSSRFVASAGPDLLRGLLPRRPPRPEVPRQG